MAWFRCSSIVEEGLSYVDVIDNTLTEDQLTYEVPFDNTKTIEAFIQYCMDSTISYNSMTGAWAQRKLDGNGYLYNLHIINGQGSESSTNANVSLAINTTSGKITMTSETRPWRNNKTYRNIIIYTE